MGEWEHNCLKEITTKIGSGATPRGGANSYQQSGIPLIRSQNVLDLSFSENGLAFIDDEQAGKLDNVIVEENDLLLNITGDSVARVCKVPKYIVPARVNQHVAIIRINSDLSHSDFILYYLQSIKPHLLSISEIGGTRRALTKGMIEELAIPLPPLPEQKAIAEVLSSLDDKIDLLHRQNKTLEQMAETLFRQWFIEPSLNPSQGEGDEEAADDWEEYSLYDAIQLIGGGTPKTSNPAYWNGDIKWLSGGDIASNHKSIIITSEKTISQEGLQHSSAKLLQRFSTVISARGTVGKYCILSEPMTFSQSNYGIEPKFKDCYFFTYLLINHSVEELNSAAYGSVFDTITTNTFKGLFIALPNETEIIKFEETIKDYFYKILNNQRQIKTLEKLRDILLPKLMSGEIKVNY